MALTISNQYSQTTFRKGAKGYCLIGIPARLASKIYARLFELKCTLLEVFQDKNQQYIALHFLAPAEVAAKLALLFPAPAECEPLLINAQSTRIVGGSAAKAQNLQRQAVIGEVVERQIGLLA